MVKNRRRIQSGARKRFWIQISLFPALPLRSERLAPPIAAAFVFWLVFFHVSQAAGPFRPSVSVVVPLVFLAFFLPLHKHCNGSCWLFSFNSSNITRYEPKTCSIYRTVLIFLSTERSQRCIFIPGANPRKARDDCIRLDSRKLQINVVWFLAIDLDLLNILQWLCMTTWWSFRRKRL